MRRTIKGGDVIPPAPLVMIASAPFNGLTYANCTSMTLNSGDNKGL